MGRCLSSSQHCKGTCSHMMLKLPYQQLCYIERSSTQIVFYYGRPMEYSRPLYFHPVVSIFFYVSSTFFFLAWSQRPHIGCLPYFDTWCGPSANLECRSETCCARLAENAGPKNRQKFAIWVPSHKLSGYIFTTKARIDNRKKNGKQQYLLHMSPQYGELQPTSGWDQSGSLGHPCKFQQVSCLGRVTAWHSSSGHQPNFAALNRGHHLYSAGWPPRWALAHISNL